MINAASTRRLLAAVIVIVGGVSVAPGANRRAAADDGDTARTLDDATRKKVQLELRSPAARTRRRAIESLARNSDLESMQIVLQQGLHDKALEVVRASLDALDQIRDGMPNDAVDQTFIPELTGRIEGEFRNAKRRSSDFAVRLIRSASRAPLPTMYDALFRIDEQLNEQAKPIWLSGVLGGMDDLAEKKDPRAVELLPLLSRHACFKNHYGYRRTVCCLAGSVPSPASVTFLIEQLATAQGELRAVIAANLQRLTGNEAGADAAAWSEWWGSRRDSFQFPGAVEYGTLRAAGSTPSYYGLPVYADRLVFVLDTSKSMAIGRSEPRIEIAKRELIRAIGQLPESTFFNIVVFNSTVSAWHESLAPAIPRWKEAAAEFVAMQRPQGRTITYDALVAAMGLHDDVEALYFLSDGAPSMGTIVNPEQIVESIARQNHLRRLTINSIGLFGGGADDARGLELFMQRLAAANFGQFRRID
jgi:hypothetical protein